VLGVETLNLANPAVAVCLTTGFFGEAGSSWESSDSEKDPSSSSLSGCRDCDRLKEDRCGAEAPKANSPGPEIPTLPIFDLLLFVGDSWGTGDAGDAVADAKEREAMGAGEAGVGLALEVKLASALDTFAVERAAEAAGVSSCSDPNMDSPSMELFKFKPGNFVGGTRRPETPDTGDDVKADKEGLPAVIGTGVGAGIAGFGTGVAILDGVPGCDIVEGLEGVAGAGFSVPGKELV
jgi:hypothetical protein